MKKFFAKHKYTIFFSALILAIAAMMRLYRLTSLPIFADEAIYVRWAQVMRAEETLRFLPLSDGKQPLFMWSVIPLLKIFSDPLFAGRFLSVLSGLGTIVGVFFTARLLFKSEKIGLIAALITAISPFALFFDRMALVDSMLTFFGVWTFYFAAQAATTLRLDFAMIAGFALGGALLTKSPGLFFFILIPTTVLLVKFPKNKKRIAVLGKFVLLVLVAWAIGYGLENILRLGPNFHLLATRNQDYVYPYIHILERPLDPLTPFLKATFNYFWLMGPGTLLVLTALGTYFCIRQNRKVAVLLGAWIGFPLFAVVEFAKVYTARYILFMLPFVALVSSAAFLAAGKNAKKVVTAALIVFILQAFYIDTTILTDVEKAALPRSERSGYLEEWTAGFGIKEVSDIVRQVHETGPSQKIVVGTEGYFGTLPDGLQIYLNDLPEITVVGVGLGINKVPQPLAESKDAGNKTYLVVNSNRFLADADNLGLKLLAVYPKAVKPDRSRESLLLFEVK